MSSEACSTNDGDNGKLVVAQDSLWNNIVKFLVYLFQQKESLDSSDDKDESIGSRLREKRKSKKQIKVEEVEQTLVKYVGSRRSAIRWIGSNLIHIFNSWTTFHEQRKKMMTKTVSFLATNYDQMCHNIDYARQTMVPSLADLGELVWDEADIDDEDEVFDDDCRSETTSAVDWQEWKSEASSQADWSEWKEDVHSADSSIRCAEWLNNEVTEMKVDNDEVDIDEVSESDKDGASSSKISELEEELAKMRDMIAVIISQQSESSQSTATPVAVVQPLVHHVAPPPPPPPPLPPPMSSKSYVPIKKKAQHVNFEESTDSAPSMGDVLQGLSSVKLKKSSMNRSPGGTPMKPTKPHHSANSLDPADIIARALKEKFQNSRQCINSAENSPVTPNSGFTPSPSPKKLLKKNSSPFRKASPHKVACTKARPKLRPRKRLAMASMEEQTNV